ncbi:MAG: YfcE family phosphodiesterase [Myxococcales bacterium]|nr:YfcE family phosphodiesterase [Myxococcales bacterium]
MSEAAWDGKPIRIGVLADTHCNGNDDPEPIRRLLTGPFAGIRMILHAGDLVDYDWLTQIAMPDIELLAVAGNCDEPGDPRLPAKRIVEFGGFRVGLMHGWGAPAGITQRLAGAFEGEAVAAVVFGHTHQPFLATESGITYFNPGSPTEPRLATAGVGLLTVTPGRLRWQHIQQKPWW